MMKALTESAVDGVTLFESTGWRGVIAGEGFVETPLFPVPAGAVFPVWLALSQLFKYRFSEMIGVRSGAPLLVDAFLLHAPKSTRLVVFNKTGVIQRCSVDFDAVRSWRLNETNVRQAIGISSTGVCRPAWNPSAVGSDISGSQIRLLNPFEILVLEARS
jgi:hypothetical protein